MRYTFNVQKNPTLKKCSCPNIQLHYLLPAEIDVSRPERNRMICCAALFPARGSGIREDGDVTADLCNQCL